jgi:hypothetical protein
MFKGDIFITDDIQLATNLSYDPRYRVFALMDNYEAVFGNNSNVIGIPFLLPPYTALEEENMGNLQNFYNLYYQHLASDEADNYIVTLLTGLYRGFNILFYVPADESDGMEFRNALLKYIQDVFGLTIGSKENPRSGFNIAYEDIIRLKMYYYGNIPAMDLVENIKNKIMDPILCDRMCSELGISNNGDPVSAVDQYITNYRNAKTKKLIDPPFTIRF